MRISLGATLLFACSLLALTDAKAPNINPAGKAQPPLQLPTFCKRFRTSCMTVATKNSKRGEERKIVYSCKKRSNNVSFTFGCRVGKTDYTAKALKSLSEGKTVTAFVDGGTLTVGTTQTSLVTTVPLTTQTVDETASTESITSASPTTTITTVPEEALTTEVETLTATETQFLTYSTSTSISTEVLTSTLPGLFGQIGTDLFPVVVYEITLPAAPGRRDTQRLDKSTFCGAYSRACTRQCARVKSKPRHQVCQKRAAPGQYALTCICKNGITETQHALADAGKEQKVVIVATKSTLTTTATETVTVSSPSTILTTQTLTATSYFTTPTTVVSTVTSTSTRTLSTSTTATLSPTVSVLASTVTTTSTTTSVPASSSTIVVVGPTGVIQARLTSDATDKGYLGQSSIQPNRIAFGASLQNAFDFFIVRDAPTGRLRLQRTSTGEYFGFELGVLGANFVPGSNSYVWLTKQANTSPAPGPPQSGGTFVGNAYETWVISKLAVSSTSPTTSPVELFGSWINADGSDSPLFWLADRDDVNFMYASADVAAFNAARPVNAVRFFFGPRP